MAERSIYEMESNAAAVALKELAEPLKVANDVLNLATNLHANDAPAEKLPKAKIVRLLLLQRIQNDLRCCIILVERGYPLQAVAVAAGIFEAWVTVANIKTEDDAVKWLSHAKENESFGHIRPLTEQALENIVGDAKYAETMYRQYQQLCMAKHLNPIVERSRGYERLEGGIIFRRSGHQRTRNQLRLVCSRTRLSIRLHRAPHDSRQSRNASRIATQIRRPTDRIERATRRVRKALAG